MRTQQQAERAEQQRIKSLVLNYDLRDDDINDGGFDPLQPDTNRPRSTKHSKRNGPCRMKPLYSAGFNNLSMGENKRPTPPCSRNGEID